MNPNPATDGRVVDIPPRRPAEAVSHWLRARGQQVTMLDAAGVAPAVTPFRPIPATTCIVQHRNRPAALVLLLARAMAAWSAHSVCWTFAIAGAELDDFRARAAADSVPARVMLLALGGADRLVPKAPPIPDGLFVAHAAGIEREGMRTFGRGGDRRIIVCVSRWPWRRLATLEDLDLSA